MNGALRSAGAGLPEALPGDVLHGLALRPPEAGWDGQRYRGSELASVRLAEARSMAGVVAAVRRGHFVGVVAVSPLYARQAADSLAPVWQSPAGHRAAAACGGAAGAAAYTWRMAPSPAAAGVRVAAWSLPGQTRVWLPPCPPDARRMARRELAALLRQPETAISLDSWQDAGPDRGLPGDGPMFAHPLDLLDAVADAALLSQAVGRPVCVACRSGPAGELVLRPPEAPVLRAAAPPSGDAARPDGAGHGAPPLALRSDTPWAVRPSLARLLSRPRQANACLHPTVHADFAVQPAARPCAAPHAGVQDLNAAQVFAQESLWYEQALARGVDPLAWRLRHLSEGRGRDLARQVAEQARAFASGDAGNAPRAGGLLRGSGFAAAQAQCVDENGDCRTVWSAWVAEVAVQPQTGHIEVTRVVAGHDSQHLRAAQSAPFVREIVHQAPELLAGARRLLAGPPAFDDWAGLAAPAAKARSTVLAAREGPGDLRERAPAGDGALAHGMLASDGVLTLPAAAAIANAIQDATGVRLRQAPFDAEQLRRACAASGRARARNPLRRAWGWLAAGAAGVAGMAAMIWPLRPAMPPTAGPDVSLYSPQAIERGRLVAAAGDCVACHTAPGGAANAGGLALETPFGTIYSTNITPDNETGIGRWSYGAFERAMRQGIHRDGRRLYPAFPYTAFAKLSDADLQALYGYLMSQPAVTSSPPETRLAFPFGLRPLLAGWNLLFHSAGPFSPDPARSAEWNRGAYLVEGAGHCAACHSPRNALGAEKRGPHYLAGGLAEGWTAPALDRLASGKLPWSRDELYQYLRTGYSPRHGVAAGPMAPVIHGLAELPESDVLAIVAYLMDLPKPAAAVAPSAAPPASAPDAGLSIAGRRANGERIYRNACAACHEAGSGPTLFGVKPPLGLNTNLHAATPDNLVHVILNGIQAPANDELGYMPGFGHSLDDRQIADLIDYLRGRFAPEEEAWTVDTTTISRLRAHAQQE